MASFRVHIVCGGLWGAGAGFGVFAAGWCNLAQSAALGVLGMIGAALPDVDSRNARPRQILLGVLGIALPVLLASRFWKQATVEQLFLWMIGIYLVIQYGAAFLLSKCSRHRGAFHSIPAALLTAEVVYLVFAGSELSVRLSFALAAGGGYLSHLLLDELWSVKLIGATEKASAGTAFTWRTDSWCGTLLFYLVVTGAGVLCWVSTAGSCNLATSPLLLIQRR